MYILDENALKNDMLSEAHESKLSMYPGINKTYQDLKGVYWWTSMKKEMIEYVVKYEVSNK